MEVIDRVGNIIGAWVDGKLGCRLKKPLAVETWVKKKITDHLLPVTKGQSPDDRALHIEFEYAKVSEYGEKKIYDCDCANKTRRQVFKERRERTEAIQKRSPFPDR